MHAENAITMQAPLDDIFKTAGNVAGWPEILPHYRWVRTLERTPSGTVVSMAARRGPIPIKWTSEVSVDEKKKEIHFRHLKAFTKGMHVVWTFTPTAGGVEVRILHDLEPTIPIVGRFIAETIIGKFFIHHVATRTLRHMKQYVEHTYGT